MQIFTSIAICPRILLISDAENGRYYRLPNFMARMQITKPSQIFSSFYRSCRRVQNLPNSIFIATGVVYMLPKGVASVSLFLKLGLNCSSNFQRCPILSNLQHMHQLIIGLHINRFLCDQCIYIQKKRSPLIPGATPI